MSSNYPPGVTGNEPEIAGRPVRTMNVDCEEDDVTFISAQEVLEALMKARDEMTHRGAGLTPRSAVDFVEELIDQIDVVERECYWSGEVEVEVEGDTAYWDCPRCGQSNEYELDDGPDPDEQRDRMMEERWAE